MTSMAELKPQHFLWEVDDGIATVRLDRPERKNPLTFESYAELRDTFRSLAYADDVDVVVDRARTAATSARAATCTTSSGHSSAWT